MKSYRTLVSFIFLSHRDKRTIYYLFLILFKFYFMIMQLDLSIFCRRYNVVLMANVQSRLKQRQKSTLLVTYALSARLLDIRYA